jgi:hypothetical protein
VCLASRSYIIVTLLLGLTACGGGGDDDFPAPSPPKQLYKNCVWQYSLPGLPSSGGQAFRCYIVTECGSGDFKAEEATCVKCPC